MPYCRLNRSPRVDISRIYAQIGETGFKYWRPIFGDEATSVQCTVYIAATFTVGITSAALFFTTIAVQTVRCEPVSLSTH